MVELTELQKAVIKQMSDVECDYLEDVETYTLEELQGVLKCSCGAAGGFSGFIYYSDTLQFFDNNKDLILELAKEECKGIYGNDDIFSMFHSFNGLKDLSITDIVEGIYTPDSEYETDVKNCLAWYALEETAYTLEEEIDNELTKREETKEE